MRPRLVGLLLPLLFLAGCMQPAAESLEPASGTTPGPRPVVVALVDTGINPYHEAFQAEGPDAFDLWGSAVGARPLALTPVGTFEERFAADADLWAGLERGVLYAFRGTRVLAISFADFPPSATASTGLFEETEPIHVFDAVDHGTATAATVLASAPSALILMVKVDAAYCTSVPPDCVTSPSTAEGAAYAAAQPWVDVLSASLGGPTGNVPQAGVLVPEETAFAEATRIAHEAGKLIFVSAGNWGGLTGFGHYNGAPWVISVGGWIHARNGTEALAGMAPDVVADFLAWAPVTASVDGYRWHGGTSFSTPRVAGEVAAALGIVRERGDAATSARPLRDALNATARLPGPTEYDPTAEPTNETPRNLFEQAVPVVAAPVQVGWGLVELGMAEEIAARALDPTLPLAEGKAAAALWRAQVQQAREAWWRATSP